MNASYNIYLNRDDEDFQKILKKSVQYLEKRNFKQNCFSVNKTYKNCFSYWIFTFNFENLFNDIDLQDLKVKL